MQLYLIGVGALGSNLLVEMCKRALAVELPISIHAFDDDTIERRNVVAQAFDYTDIGKPKVSICERLAQENPYVTLQSYEVRVTKENIFNLIPPGKGIIIDVVDNVESRWMLWEHGMATQMPVLHGGMATSGSGSITWTYKTYDTFGLNPTKMSYNQKQVILNAVETKLPPCELNSFRPLIMNTVFGLLEALFISLGRDVSNYVTDLTEGANSSGVLTNWSATTTTLTFDKQYTHWDEF